MSSNAGVSSPSVSIGFTTILLFYWLIKSVILNVNGLPLGIWSSIDDVSWYSCSAFLSFDFNCVENSTELLMVLMGGDLFCLLFEVSCCFFVSDDCLFAFVTGFALILV